jgi:hypothetical protein
MLLVTCSSTALLSTGLIGGTMPLPCSWAVRGQAAHWCKQWMQGSQVQLMLS